MRGNEVTQAIMDGSLVKGDTVWVCCLYYRDVANSKPTRRVEPVQVTRSDNNGIPSWVRNLSSILFEMVEYPHKEIPLQNNVRDSRAILSVFATEEECRVEYASMIAEVRRQVIAERARVTKSLDALDASLDAYEAEWGKR